MARTTQSMKHTHKYYRVESTGLWHCINCSHYMPGNMPPPIGRMSLCWKCDNEFMLTAYNMANSKPICENCEEGHESFNLDDYMAQQTAKRKQAIAEGHEPDCEQYLGGECHCVIVPPEDEIEVYDPEEEND